MPIRKYDWPALFKAFDRSGLSQAEFCRSHQINPKYFSGKLSKRSASSNRGFNELLCASDPIDSAANEIAQQLPSISLQVGRCRVDLPSHIDAKTVVELVRSLA